MKSIKMLNFSLCKTNFYGGKLRWSASQPLSSSQEHSSVSFSKISIITKLFFCLWTSNMGLHCPFDPQEILENWLLESHFSLYGVIFLLFSFSIFRIKKNQQMHCSQILQQFLRSLACYLPVIFWFYMYPCCLISCSIFQSFTLLIEKGVTFLRKTYVHIVGVSL